MCLLSAGPPNRAPHTLQFQFGANDDLLSVHALRKKQRGLANLAGARFARIKTASNFDFAIETLGVNAEYSRHARDAVVCDAQNQFHRAIALSLPNQRWANAVAKSLLHGAERVGVFLVVSANVIGFSPESEIICADIKSMEARRFAVRLFDWTADTMWIVVGRIGFVVAPHKHQHRRRQFVQTGLLNGGVVREHVVTVLAVLDNGCQPGGTMRKFLDLDWLIHDQAVGAQPAS